MYYVFDLETEKLHIHTDSKQAYLSLPQNVRDTIKRGCLWSHTRGCWVSRSKGKANWWLDTLVAAGFEDRGEEGQRLTFAEQVQAEQDRAAERADRAEELARKAGQEAGSLAKTASEMFHSIPFGQPILVGHYSEQRDRNFRARAARKMDRALEEGDKSKYYAERATTARATAEGRHYSNPAFLGRRIKEQEAELRKIERHLEGKSYVYSEARPISDAYRTQLEEAKARIEDKLGFFRYCLKTCTENGTILWTRENLQDKTAVLIRGAWQEIVRLNPTTIVVPNICFNTPESQRKYGLKYNYTDVRDAR